VRVVVPDAAFEELLDTAHLAEEAGEEEGNGADRRRRFAVEVDRAVKKVLACNDGEDWHTHLLRRFECRLFFFRQGDDLFLIACLPYIPRRTLVGGRPSTS
jgi:hypothetical protein